MNALFFLLMPRAVIFISVYQWHKDSFNYIRNWSLFWQISLLSELPKLKGQPLRKFLGERLFGNICYSPYRRLHQYDCCKWHAKLLCVVPAGGGDSYKWHVNLLCLHVSVMVMTCEFVVCCVSDSHDMWICCVCRYRWWACRRHWWHVPWNKGAVWPVWGGTESKDNIFWGLFLPGIVGCSISTL